jgi:amino acid permease
VRILKGSRHLAANTLVHWATWLSCTAGSVIIGYIIASAIPIFGSLIGFIGALICPVVCLIPYPIMWWHDNWRGRTKEERSVPSIRINFYLNVILLIAGLFLMIAGTYGSVVDLINTTVDTGPWTCADNSGSVAA